MEGKEERKLTIKEKALRYKHKHRGLKLDIGLVVLGVAVLLMIFVSGSSLLSIGASNAASEDSDLGQNNSTDLFKATFVGDVNLARGEEKLSSIAGASSIFSKTKSLWADSDLVLGNLESVLLDESEKYKSAKDGSIKLGADSGYAKSLKEAGFTALSLANNHAVDYGKKGLRSTISALESQGIDVLGAGENSDDASEPIVKDVNGFKVAVYSVSDIVPEDYAATLTSPGIATTNNSDIFMSLYEMRSSADLIVVNMHWGYEYTSTENEEQQELAHSLIEAGADVVIGEHSHTLQPVEIYQGKLIAYGLGDYSHDNAWTRTKDGAVLQLTIGSQRQINARIQFIRIENGIPTSSVGDFYVDRDVKTVAQHLSESDYRLDGSVVSIPLGDLGDNDPTQASTLEEEAQQDD